MDRPLVDGEPAFRRICEAVYTAHRNVWVTVPFLSPRSRALRCELFSEHLGQGTADLDDLAAMSLYRQIARDNRRRRDVGDFDWQGLAFSLDPATYAA